MEKYPKVSIIIPCYNNGKYLKDMIECFLKQSVNDWEMIIVDDGSTDDTKEIIKQYSMADKRISLYTRNRSPKGSVVCRNIGFEKAKGKYVCHLDADDLVSEKFVENRVGFMEMHPELDYASFCAKVFIDGESKLPNFNSNVKTFGIRVNRDDLLEDFLTGDYSFSVWNNIYKREALIGNPWDEKVKIYTDFSFIIPGILRGMMHAFSDIAEVDYFYRIFPKKSNSINMCSNFVSDEKCTSTLYLFDKTLKSIETLCDSSCRKNQFKEYIVLHLERLLNDKKINASYSFVQMLSKYYDSSFIDSLQICIERVDKFNSRKIIKIFLDYYLYTTFRYPIYKKQLTHDAAKFFLGRL